MLIRLANDVNSVSNFCKIDVCFKYAIPRDFQRLLRRVGQHGGYPHSRRQRSNHLATGLSRHRDGQKEDGRRKLWHRFRDVGPTRSPHHNGGQVSVSGSPVWESFGRRWSRAGPLTNLQQLCNVFMVHMCVNCGLKLLKFFFSAKHVRSRLYYL